ncbi:MAG: V-type ATP synthase subunit E family protein [Bacilli bacterium]
MAENKLYEKIIEKGKAEAKAIVTAGEAKAGQIAEEILSAARAEADKIISEAKLRADDRIKTKTIEFEQQARHKLLKAKKELIERVISAAAAKLKELPDEKFVELTVKMLKRESLAGDEIVKVSADEFARYKRLFCSGKEKEGLHDLDKLNDLLGPGLGLRLSSEAVDIDGGFILVGRDYDIDLSYEAILSALNESREPEIAKLLFRTEG